MRNVETIGKNTGLTKTELEPIKMAAWFHDIGFCELYLGHENVSIKIAQNFLIENEYSEEQIEIVTECIKATKMPQSPQNKYAEILSDADIFHISNDTFFYRKLLLRREWEIEFNKYSTDYEWHQLNLEFLDKHKFFTEYGKSELMRGQLKNEERVKNLIKLY